MTTTDSRNVVFSTNTQMTFNKNPNGQGPFIGELAKSLFTLNGFASFSSAVPLIRFMLGVNSTTEVHSSNYRPQLSCAKVMFLPLSVILSIGDWRGSATPPLGRHPPGRHPPPLGRYPQADTLLPWADTPRQTPPSADTPQADSRSCAVHAGIQSTSGRYASYWNAFLFLNVACEQGFQRISFARPWWVNSASGRVDFYRIGKVG